MGAGGAMASKADQGSSAGAGVDGRRVCRRVRRRNRRSPPLLRPARRRAAPPPAAPRGASATPTTRPPRVVPAAPPPPGPCGRVDVVRAEIFLRRIGAGCCHDVGRRQLRGGRGRRRGGRVEVVEGVETGPRRCLSQRRSRIRLAGRSSGASSRASSNARRGRRLHRRSASSTGGAGGASRNPQSPRHQLLPAQAPARLGLRQRVPKAASRIRQAPRASEGAAVLSRTQRIHRRQLLSRRGVAIGAVEGASSTSNAAKPGSSSGRAPASSSGSRLLQRVEGRERLPRAQRRRARPRRLKSAKPSSNAAAVVARRRRGREAFVRGRRRGRRRRPETAEVSGRNPRRMTQRLVPRSRVPCRMSAAAARRPGALSKLAHPSSAAAAATAAPAIALRPAPPRAPA